MQHIPVRVDYGARSSAQRGQCPAVAEGIDLHKLRRRHPHAGPVNDAVIHGTIHLHFAGFAAAVGEEHRPAHLAARYTGQMLAGHIQKIIDLCLHIHITQHAAAEIDVLPIIRSIERQVQFLRALAPDQFSRSAVNGFHLSVGRAGHQQTFADTEHFAVAAAAPGTIQCSHGDVLFFPPGLRIIMHFS